MAMTREQVVEALRSVPVPGTDRTLDKTVVWAAENGGQVSVRLHVEGLDDRSAMESLASSVADAVSAAARGAAEGLGGLIVEFVDGSGEVVHRTRPPLGSGHRAEPSPPGQGGGGHRPIRGLSGGGDRPQGEGVSALPGVTHAIAVGAGKGGVGKSTVAVNLAVGLARRGHAVGLLDGDIYGPSLPTMLGLASLEQAVVGGRLSPHAVHGVKAITIGKLVDAEKPLIWRGPMAHGAFKQLVERTDWGELDYLIIDLPPGTGDVSLTMAQTLRLTGAVVVCTPQKVAQDDAVRAARMFQQLGVGVLGVVENMSWFVGDDGKEYDIFGRGGAEMMAQRLGVPFLGAVPITMGLRANSDSGEPVKNFDAETAGGAAMVEALEGLVRNLEGQVALAGMQRKGPELRVS